jgi:hypothetical protein
MQHLDEELTCSRCSRRVSSTNGSYGARAFLFAERIGLSQPFDSTIGAQILCQDVCLDSKETTIQALAGLIPGHSSIGVNITTGFRVPIVLRPQNHSLLFCGIFCTGLELPMALAFTSCVGVQMDTIFGQLVDLCAEIERCNDIPANLQPFWVHAGLVRLLYLGNLYKCVLSPLVSPF